MDTMGIYIFNATKNGWLQDDGKSWGPLSGACEYPPGEERAAETLREKIGEQSDDTTWTVALLH